MGWYGDVSKLGTHRTSRILVKKKETVDSRAILTHISIFSGCSSISLLPKKSWVSRTHNPQQSHTHLLRQEWPVMWGCDGMWCWEPRSFIPRLSDWPRFLDIYIIILCTYCIYIFGGIWSKHTYFILYIIYVQHIHAYQKIIGVSVSIQKPSHPLLSLPTRWAGLVHLRSKGRESEVPGIHGKTSVEGQPGWLKWKYISKKHNQIVNGALLGWNL